MWHHLPKRNRLIVLVPFVVARLTQPAHVQRLVVVVVMGLDGRASVAVVLSGTAALGTDGGPHELAALDGLLDLVVRPIRAANTAAIEVIVSAEANMRAHLDTVALEPLPKRLPSNR